MTANSIMKMLNSHQTTAYFSLTTIGCIFIEEEKKNKKKLMQISQLLLNIQACALASDSSEFLPATTHYILTITF